MEDKLKLQSISILDTDYTKWIKELKLRYRKSQVKAAVRVNTEMLRFYWELGRDIVELQAENKYGSKFYASLSRDLRNELQNAEGLSESNIRYANRFYILYKPVFNNLQQTAEKSTLTGNTQNLQQLAENFDSTVISNFQKDIFSVPWGHHQLLIDKCKNDTSKAIFYVNQTVENGWSRSMLRNFISSNLYERKGNAISNFSTTLPEPMSDLAQELTKDPYNFAFIGITIPYNETLLKNALLNNITNFLVELGTGFAYVGKEYRLQIGETENFIDLLFYNLKLSCYVVIEVKIGKFQPSDIGQLGTYVVACNHILKKEGRDNPTIGLLICKEKDRIQAQYALESTSQPLSVSEYELEKFYPEKIEGTIPSIKEIETSLLSETTQE